MTQLVSATTFSTLRGRVTLFHGVIVLPAGEVSPQRDWLLADAAASSSTAEGNPFFFHCNAARVPQPGVALRFTVPRYDQTSHRKCLSVWSASIALNFSLCPSALIYRRRTFARTSLTKKSVSSGPAPPHPPADRETRLTCAYARARVRVEMQEIVWRSVFDISHKISCNV